MREEEKIFYRNLAERYFTPLHYGWLGKRRRTRLSVASKIAKIAQMSFKAVAFSFKRKKK